MEPSDIPTSQHLLVQYQQWKHQKNVRIYLKNNSSDTRVTSIEHICLVLSLLFFKKYMPYGYDYE